VSGPTETSGLVSVDDVIDAIAREALDEARRREEAESVATNSALRRHESTRIDESLA
jgi:hypothetical protein